MARFFVAGVSGGGPYVFAASYFLPERVRGAMTISTLAPPGRGVKDPDMVHSNVPNLQTDLPWFGTSSGLGMRP